MRWLMLYAHSRQVPASLATVLISAVAVWALTRDGSTAPAGSHLPAVVLTAGAMALSTGLGGQDLDLDRSAAIRWAPRRAAHVLIGGAIVGTVLLTVQALGQDLATTAFVARDCAGLTGLAALGASVAGGRYAWAFPFTWLAFAFLAPPPATTVPLQVATWMLLPAGTPAATWTALCLAVVGTALYALAGPEARTLPAVRVSRRGRGSGRYAHHRRRS
ncbi:MULTISPECIES: hypothetical protein [unclassified Streptomyces]|uniref:hypothetical protein n=1 Tax=unclassified Streptomyces TaxID=2593676 RepID=UPI001F5B4074|nr:MULTISPECIES: hypothetical protein [unclassified Streptomyces]